MFLLTHLRSFTKCVLSNTYVQINTIRNISRGLQLQKQDVYVQRISKRFAESECAFPHQMDPNCKVAIITGGETGIGYATANDLLTNGAQVVVLAGVCDGESAVAKITEDHGQGRACFMHMDVNDEREFEELFYRINSVFGKIDIVFNNAGIMQDHAWDYEVDTNLKSVLRGTMLALDYMGKDGKGNKKDGGLIINHSDAMALEGFPYAPCYMATKAGILGATLSFGADYHYRQTGVRVVGLLSGPTDTALIHNAADKQLSTELGKAAAAALIEHQPQSPAVVGRAVTHMVKYAPPGSLWTVEKGELFITRLPNRKSYSKKVTQL